MKALKIILTIIVFPILLSCADNSIIEFEPTVNAVIGDISFVETFGASPGLETKEDLRLQTHLKYVESLLRNKDVSHLSKEQQINRLKVLDLLTDYWKEGIFPRNYDYPDTRTPVFIDKDGRICAVGYLIEKTVGREVSEEINSKFKHEHLLAMNDATIDNWIESNGLTKVEAAMIQPNYGTVINPPDNTDVELRYGIGTTLISAVNLSLNTINGIQVLKGSESENAALLGIFTGLGQITFGALNLKKDEFSPYSPEVNSTLRNYSFINIGLGTTTIILSSWNLVTNRKQKQKSVSWNVVSYPIDENSVAMGLSLTKRF